MKWDRFVDLISVVWVGIFILGQIYSRWRYMCDNINIFLLSIFVADLVVKYRKVHNWKVFLKRHWWDILIVIPYFRIFRVLKSLRILRVLRIGRSVKVVKTTKAIKGVKSVKAIKNMGFIKIAKGIKGLESMRRKIWRLMKKVF